MVFTHKHLNILAAAKYKDPEAYLNDTNFGTIYATLWNEHEEEHDTRTGAQIISDTLKDFKIKIREGAK